MDKRYRWKFFDFTVIIRAVEGRVTDGVSPDFIEKGNA
jgi:hypothetical protein